MIARLFGTTHFTGRHMAAVMGLFFGTIIAVNLTMAFFATSTWSGLVVSNPYVEGQRFDSVTATRKRQAARGWSIDSTYADGRFAVSLVDRDRQPVQAGTVSAKIGRPATEQQDRTLSLQPLPGGGYGAETELTRGLWDADVTVAMPGADIWEKRIRFHVEAAR